MYASLWLRRALRFLMIYFMLVGASQAASLFSNSNKFLIFPNPIVNDDGTYETNSIAYARAYYETIDPNNERDTFEKWKAKNQYGSNPSAQHHVIFGDTRDLGYGRDLNVWKNSDGSIAAYVRNFQVNGYTSANYNHLNLVAAIKNATKRYHVGTNAIEYSLGPNGEPNFVKFYNFDPKTGRRNLTVDLDGRGQKAMPGICASCHGGRLDPLTPPSAVNVLGNPLTTPRPLFAKVQNSFSQARGDIQARMQPLKVNTFDFAPEFGYSRAAQEAAMKAINQIVLCSYPRVGAAAGAEDGCRPVVGTTANFDEWLGTTAAFIKAAYGGAGMPSTTFVDNYVPTSWQATTNSRPEVEVLYTQVVAPACMTCHMARGTGNMADIDFTSFDNSFKEGSQISISPGLPYLPSHFSYLERIKAHVFERGNMPLAKIVSDTFWSGGMADKLARYLETEFATQASNIKTSLGATDQDLQDIYQIPASVSLHSPNGAVLKPGRPIANPGPDRTIPKNTAVKLWNGSLYSQSYRWTIVSANGAAPNVNNVWLADPARPTVHNLTSSAPNPTIQSSDDNTIYRVSLAALSGRSTSETRTIRVAVNDALFAAGSVSDATSYPKPADIRFSHIKYRLQNLTCTSCHYSGSLVSLPFGGSIPPIFYNDYDRNADSSVDATDDLWFYKELRGRINFTDIFASPLLRKPSGHHHAGGGPFGGMNLSIAPGVSDPAALASKVDRTTYDLFVNWIINGAPYQ